VKWHKGDTDEAVLLPWQPGIGYIMGKEMFVHHGNGNVRRQGRPGDLNTELIRVDCGMLICNRR